MVKKLIAGSAYGREDVKSDALSFVLAERERELFEIKGPCSNAGCRLHYAHSGPCDMRASQ